MPIPTVNDPSQYFLDASFVISFVDSNDSSHGKALEVFNKIRESDHEVYLSDVLLNEVYTVLGKRCERSGRLQDYKGFVGKMADFVANRPVLCLYEMFNNFYREIVALMTQTQGRLSFHDCLIVFFLKEVPDVTLVTFDGDFERVKGLKILSVD